METFRLYFNRRQQWANVYVHNISPDTFERRGGGRWGYYVSGVGRERFGLFGEIHLVENRIRHDVVAHELMHMLADVLRVRRMTLNERTEERIAVMFDELTRSFWRAYESL